MKLKNEDLKTIKNIKKFRRFWKTLKAQKKILKQINIQRLKKKKCMRTDNQESKKIFGKS